ncbi:gamma-glutamylcyclotransferase [Streptomyces durbertensis]|uniref:Gamma-glutamylcyclotransferase n=2 Tax=Streptomyces durbertensis TaxID=2448886 RepID=A0ABR6EBY7_9ACTN|nr:gamma-glutamylcyclotransferase [Streptomyces durbertensis]
MAGSTGERLPFFVYGTLRPGGRHHAWALRGRTVREEPARMAGLVLYQGPGYPYAVAGEGEVRGELVVPRPGEYEEVLRVLDELEEYRPGDPANVYERVAAEARPLVGGVERAWVYLAAAPLAARLRAEGVLIAGGDWAKADR